MENRKKPGTFRRKRGYLMPVCFIAAVVSLTIAVALILHVIGMPSLIV